MRHIYALIIIVAWLAGVVFAKGFWLTFAAVCFPPYAWYLVVERALIMTSVI